MISERPSGVILVLCLNQNLGSGKGVRSQLCEAPEGPFRQLTPDPFTRPTPKLNGDKALEAKSSMTVFGNRTSHGSLGQAKWIGGDSKLGVSSISLGPQGVCSGFRVV